MASPDQVKGLFEALAQQLVTKAPEMQVYLDRAKAGEITESEAMQEMMRSLHKHPDLARWFMQQAKTTLAPLREDASMAIPERSLGGMPMFHAGVGLPQVNPIVQGAMVERRQFDGDVPEWRTGPLHPEMLPSVPVNAPGVRNPHMLGHMMHEAALRLGHHVQEHQRQDVAEAEVQRALQLASEPLPLALRGGSAETDLPEYRRGQVPAPVDAPEVVGLELDPGYAQRHLWQVIGTTVGRKSAVPIIQQMVLEALRRRGVQVTEGAGSGDPAAEYQWTMNLSGMPEMQPGFNPLDTAARVLSFSLGELVAGRPGRFVLEVRPVNNLADRTVGWASRLWQEAPS